MTTLAAIATLLLFQLAGEALVTAFRLPIPGPVIGMALLFAALLMRGGPSPELKRVAQGLLSHLSLLFVPAGVGILLYLDLIANQWLALLLSVFGGTLLTLLVTAYTLRFFLRRRAKTAGSAP